MRSSRLAAVALAGAVCVTAACTAAPDSQDQGPLDGVETVEGTTCSPTRGAEAVSFGLHYLVNESDSALELESLTLSGTRELELEGAYVLPMPGNTTMGQVNEFPPLKLARELINTPWREAVPVEGARLAPREKYNLVVHIVPTGDIASFDSMTMAYTWEGQRYESTSSLLTLFPRGRRCPRS